MSRFRGRTVMKGDIFGRIDVASHDDGTGSTGLVFGSFVQSGFKQNHHNRIGSFSRDLRGKPNQPGSPLAVHYGVQGVFDQASVIGRAVTTPSIESRTG